MAIIIVAVSLWYTNLLVREIAKNQRDNIRIWADAIHRKAELVNYTDEFFGELQNEERKRVELLAEAYKSVNYVKEGDSDVLNFLLQFITGNTTIPVVLTDERRNITFNKQSPVRNVVILTNRWLSRICAVIDLYPRLLKSIYDVVPVHPAPSCGAFRTNHFSQKHRIQRIS